MTIQEYLEKKPLLFDGAMGTYLVDKCQGLEESQCEMANISHPEVVVNIHKEYLQAGAVAIKTNTFAANRSQQKKVEIVPELIRRGYSLAKQAVEEFGKESFIFADIGPVSSEEKVFETYQEIVDIFLECGAKYFLFETLENAEELERITSYIKERTEDSFIMVSFAASPEGYTRGGFLVKKLFWRLQQCSSVDAVGFNCISGPKHLLEQVRELPMEQVEKYLTIMPNAGYPTMLGNRIHYGVSRDYFGRTACELLEAGVSIIGGCCGTTPKDIRSIAGKLQEDFLKKLAVRKQELKSRCSSGIAYSGREGSLSVGKKEALAGNVAMEGKAGIQQSEYSCMAEKNPKNSFAGKLAEGKKVLVVELDPPVEPDIDFFMEGAARYRHAGVDAIDIADCPIAKARIDSSILACKLERELGMTAIPHMTCRDRNINATKALLLGLNIEGVNNVLTVTGDPVPVAMREQIKTVFSYNSAVLARHIQSFNQEVFAKNPFMVSGALNVNALNFDSQIAHAKKKIESGVSVLFTQPVLSERGFENLKRARRELSVKLLGGIMPVVSYRNATFMSNEMAGIEIDEQIIARYKDKSREEGEVLALAISKGVIDEIEGYVDGYYVITPFKRVELILRIIEYIKQKEKQ